MKTAKGEFITIFDADFVPDPTILRRSIHYFTDPTICVVQTRWDHLNRNDSLLTRSQAILLDGGGDGDLAVTAGEGVGIA